MSGYIVELYSPNIVIKRGVVKISERTIVYGEKLKKGQVSKRVKKSIDDLKNKYPNLDTIEYYRI
jgi:hypothetical protein